MLARYPTRYRDADGELAAEIENDGKTLRVQLAGVDFAGSDFDSLEVVNGAGVLPPRFTLSSGRDLCACVLDITMPLRVLTEAGESEGRLEVHLELGRPTPRGGLDREDLRLELAVGERRFASRGRSGWFEDELDDIQRALPKGWHLQACYGCAYSDYSPYGHGLFGGLACFRGNKAGYLAAVTKQDIFRVWPTMTEQVQETYLCPDFDRRKPRAGYRGYAGLE